MKNFWSSAPQLTRPMNLRAELPLETAQRSDGIEQAFRSSSRSSRLKSSRTEEWFRSPESGSTRSRRG
jgi:hypothetical protein